MNPLNWCVVKYTDEEDQVWYVDRIRPPTFVVAKCSLATHYEIERLHEEIFSKC